MPKNSFDKATTQKIKQDKEDRDPQQRNPQWTDGRKEI